MPSMARIVSLTILTVLIVFLGLTFYQVIAPFLLPLFLAGVIAILCQPLFQYLVRRTKGRIRLAAGLTTGGVFAAVFIPLLVGVFIGGVQLYAFAHENFWGSDWNEVVQNVQDELNLDRWIEAAEPYLPPRFDAEWMRVEIQKALKAISAKTLGNAGATVGATLGVLEAVFGFVISLAMFLIALYYFLADGPNLLKSSEGLIPVHVDYQRELLGQFTRVVRSVVIATFLAAIVQGLATAVALKVVGFDHFFLFLVVSTMGALIPLAGTWLVWAPCAAWLAWQGHWVSAIGLAAWGSVVVGTLDNVIRTYVLQNDTKLHPLLAFISVLGGLEVMGLWGVFIGPIVASCLHALIQIFNTELFELSREKFGAEGSEETKKTPADTQTSDSNNGDATTTTVVTMQGDDADSQGSSRKNGGTANEKK